MWSGVYIGAALAAVGLAGAWLVARAASRRSNAQMRAEVAALRAELATALARISSQEEAAAIMARVDATIAAEAERRNRAGLVLIRGGLLVAAAAGTAASVVSRRVQEHPVLALTATTAAAGVAGFALMWPFGGLPEAISPPKQRPPAVSAPTTAPTPVATPTVTVTSPSTPPANPPKQPASAIPQRIGSDEPQPVAPPPVPDQVETTPPAPPSEPTPEPPAPTTPPPQPTTQPTPTPTPTPTPPRPHRQCTVRVGKLVCVKLPLPLLRGADDSAGMILPLLLGGLTAISLSRPSS